VQLAARESQSGDGSINRFLLLLDSTKKIPPYVKKKPSQPKPSSESMAIKVTQMNFSVLKKTAKKLRESGFFEGKISGKGVTKESLTNMGSRESYQPS